MKIKNKKVNYAIAVLNNAIDELTIEQDLVENFCPGFSDTEIKKRITVIRERKKTSLSSNQNFK